MKLLYLDSDHTSLRVFRDVFESWGFQVTSCSTGSELFRLLSRKPEIDAVITEISLPGSAKGSLIPLLRQHFKVQPLIVLTAHHSVQSAVAALKGGADEFLPKPFDVQKLKKTLFASLKAKQTGAPLKDSESELERLLTELKTHLEAVLSHNNKLRLCDLVNRISLEQISEGLLALDAGGKVILINRNMKRLLGIEEDLTGNHLFSYFPVLQDSALFALWQEHLHNKESRSYTRVTLPVLNSRELRVSDLKIFSVTLQDDNSDLAGVVFLANSDPNKNPSVSREECKRETV